LSRRSDRPLRVLYLIDKMGAGGAQTHLQGLASGLPRQRFSAELRCLVRGGVSADRLLERGLAVQIMGLKRLYGPAGLLAFGRLVADLRRSPPDLFHTYLSAANVFGALAARLAGARQLITTRRDTGFADGRLMCRALARTSPWAARIVAVSESAANVARERDGVSPDALRVIPNGIDLSRFTPGGRRREVRMQLGIPETVPLLVSVGHLTHVKGIDLLVPVTVILSGEYPDIHVCVAGRGAERERLEREIGARGLGHRLRLLGPHHDVPALLETADVFVLASRSEGQPNAIIEAMAMGVPVVATAVGGVPELMRDGSEGLLVAPEDPGALAEACRTLLGNPTLARTLGERAQLRARRDFGLASMIERYAALYEEVAALVA
jgi:glycosyltransferase involved in cell wall biosynthesis